MKVILNEEVVGLGEPGKIVDVAPGYARNFLVPRNLAVYANTGNVRELEHHAKRLERKRQRLTEAAKGVAERINGKTLEIEARAGESGKLYGSVTNVDLATALQAQYGVTVDRRKITVREPIRTMGTHEVEVSLMGDTKATIVVHVFDPAQVKAETTPAAPAVEAPAAETAEETEA